MPDDQVNGEKIMIRLIVEVTKADIREGKLPPTGSEIPDGYKRDCLCPIAIALNRTIRKTYRDKGYHFQVNESIVELKKDYSQLNSDVINFGYIADLPREARAFLQKADKNHKVKPFRFELEFADIPSSWKQEIHDKVHGELLSVFLKKFLTQSGKTAKLIYSNTLHDFMVKVTEYAKNGRGFSFLAEGCKTEERKSSKEITPSDAIDYVERGFAWTWNLDGNAGYLIIDLRFCNLNESAT